MNTDEQLLLFNVHDETEDEAIEFRYLITSYGADYPVDSLIKRIGNDVIFVPPFQRKFVWTISEASKFIESLLLGLPVPGIFLSKERETNRLLIVDGQQRLLSLFKFYKGRFNDKTFKLQNVQEDLEGKTYKTLRSADRLRLDDSIIHATIIRQDEPDDNESSVYQIFERLNSGGRALKPQEIRACIYYGEFNELLNKLVKKLHWRILFGKKENERLKEQELILRFFALVFYREKYEKPLKSFLNVFMHNNKNLQLFNEEMLTNIFIKTFKFIHETIGAKPFRINRNLNLGAFDSISVAVAERLMSSEIINIELFKKRYNTLVNDPEFINVVKGGTSDEKNVEKRIDLAINAFKDIE